MNRSRSSRHFRVEQLADGVFALIHKEGGWAIANAGIIDLGESTLVFDTFITVEAGTDLRYAAQELTGNAVSIVINSHFHNDHIWGNQAFDTQTTIISSTETRANIATKGQDEVAQYKEYSPVRLKELRAQIEDEKDERKKKELELWSSYHEGLVATLPGLSVRLPNITFQSRMRIHGTKRELELLTYTDGHTGSDTILFLPDEGILFLADLLFVDSHPYLADGDPVHLKEILDEIKTLRGDVLIPGHGPPGSKNDLDLLRDYSDHCEQAAESILDKEDAEAQIANLEIPDPFAAWDYAIFYPANIRYFLMSIKNGAG
ncbi:MAG: MBL fold metallo-hydrolase [Chloroflexi bacterium]|nr:MBL fold metallo-hydrolase [Chloroflexota bacterium]